MKSKHLKTNSGEERGTRVDSLLITNGQSLACAINPVISRTHHTHLGFGRTFLSGKSFGFGLNLKMV